MSHLEEPKVTVSIPLEELESLKRLAAERGVTVNSLLRKAIALDQFFRNETRDGTKVLLFHPDKTYERVILT